MPKQNTISHRRTAEFSNCGFSFLCHPRSRGNLRSRHPHHKRECSLRRRPLTWTRRVLQVSGSGSYPATHDARLPEKPLESLAAKYPWCWNRFPINSSSCSGCSSAQVPINLPLMAPTPLTKGGRAGDASPVLHNIANILEQRTIGSQRICSPFSSDFLRLALPQQNEPYSQELEKPL
jgi:hypothetical protein